MKSLFVLLLFQVFSQAAQASNDSSNSHLRISLLTVGVGDEIYASFGHTGIRITDSLAHTDIVYNWGTFDGFQEGFEMKFMRGKLLYYASSETWPHFYQTYVQEKRGVEEQVLMLNPAQKQQILDYITNNMKEENKYYKYDFLYDNCATRLRDIFPNTFGPGFHFGTAIPTSKTRTFRDEIDYYLRYLPWERTGIDMLLGSQIDKTMSNEDAMFLPDYLRNGVAGAQVNGKAISSPPLRVLPQDPIPAIPKNIPALVFLLFSALVILGSIIPGLGLIGLITKNILFIVTGLLGFLILFMWIGTDHQACRYNWNVLWALPTNIILPFIKRRKQSRYALLGIFMILVVLALHMFHVQAFPLVEIWPLLLALVFSYGMIYTSLRQPSMTHESAAKN